MHGHDKHQIQDGGYTGHKGELGPGTGQGYTGVYKHICHVLFLTYLKQKWQNAEPCQRWVIVTWVFQLFMLEINYNKIYKI